MVLEETALWSRRNARAPAAGAGCADAETAAVHVSGCAVAASGGGTAPTAVMAKRQTGELGDGSDVADDADVASKRARA